MVARGTPPPKKISHDAIIEAIFEMRFDQKSLSEIFYGKLAGHQRWSSYVPRSTGLAQLPKQLIDADPNLRYQPRIEAIAADSHSSLRIGEHSLSFHRKAPYTGWAQFREELSSVVTSFFDCAADPTVTRLGLRYINALNAEKHGVHSFADLDVTTTIAGQPMSSDLNLNFSSRLGERSRATVRIASQSFIQGELPDGTTVVVDLDVYTEDDVTMTLRPTVTDWIEFAHGKEKDEFFHLFKQEMIDSWRED